MPGLYAFNSSSACQRAGGVGAIHSSLPRHGNPAHGSQVSMATWSRAMWYVQYCPAPAPRGE